MKVLSVRDASSQLDLVCKEALAGEVIRLQLPDGSLVELLPLAEVPALTPVSDQDLAACYSDADWAAFENQCGTASS